MPRKDWFDDYMAYKMCSEDDGSSGKNNSGSGCLPTIIVALLVLGFISLFVR